MKFSTSLLVAGAAVASAATVPRGATSDHCPAVKKTVKLSWITVKEFTPIKKVWTYDEMKKNLSGSKYDPSQVHQYLNNTSRYPGGRPTSTKSSVPYPTGGYYNGTGPTSTKSGSPWPTGGSSTTKTSTSATASATLEVFPCTSPTTRVEWHNLNDGQRDAYISAVKCLIDAPSGDPGRFPGSRNRFEDFASLHQQQAGAIHEVGQFLPWHRYFLHVFEEVLRDECGYNGPLTWWDESIDSGNFQNSLLFNTRWFGPALPQVGDSAPCVEESGFGAYRPNLGPDNVINNPHCLSRAVDEGSSGNTGGSWETDCYGAGNYNDFRECSEYGIHAYGHLGVGSIMSNVAPSPEDPVFYLHHGYIDRHYKVWQNAEWWNRVYEIGGPSPNGGTTQPSDVLTSFGIRPDVTIADVLDTEATYLCYVYDKQ